MPVDNPQSAQSENVSNQGSACGCAPSNTPNVTLSQCCAPQPEPPAQSVDFDPTRACCSCGSSTV